MKTVKHTYEKIGNERLIYRDGEPILMAITCPDDVDHHKNVIVMQRVKQVTPMDVKEVINIINNEVSDILRQILKDKTKEKE